MFKKLFLLTLLGVAQIGSLPAYFRPTDGHVGIEAEFLYLLPSVGDTFYAGNVSRFGTVTLGTIGSAEFTKRNNDFDFIPGFRVGGAYGLCDGNQLIARYSRLSRDQSDSVNGLLLVVQSKFTGPVFNGTASSDLDLLFQNADILYGFGAYMGCKFNADIHGGLEFAYMRLNEQINYVGTGLTGTAVASNFNSKEKTWGIGPQLGFALSYDFSDLCGLCQNALSFVSRASGSLLVSETTYNQSSTTPTAYFIVSDDSSWRIVPAMHARLGLNYATCFSCFDVNLEIGYEFNSYINAMSKEVFTDSGTSNANSLTRLANFDTNGLYVSGGITF